MNKLLYEEKFVAGLLTDNQKLTEENKRLRKALEAFVFDEEIPTIGKSYWLDEFDLRRAREALGEKK